MRQHNAIEWDYSTLLFWWNITNLTKKGPQKSLYQTGFTRFTEWPKDGLTRKAFRHGEWLETS